MKPLVVKLVMFATTLAATSALVAQPTPGARPVSAPPGRPFALPPSTLLSPEALAQQKSRARMPDRLAGASIAANAVASSCEAPENRSVKPSTRPYQPRMSGRSATASTML